MKSFFKILAIAILILILAAVAGGLYLKHALPDIELDKSINIEATPDRLQRGEYLANNVSVCMDCHATRDWTVFAAPPIDGTKGKGGEAFDTTMNFPGNFYAPNITPAGIGDWTDAEVYRAVTSGVSKDGRALFSVMPWPHYGKMSREDVYSVIAYIRSLEPIDNNVPKSEAKFPVSLFLNLAPEPADHQEIPSKSDPVKYGEYMVNAAGCYDCHTEMDRGKFIGEDFAGGFKFNFPNGDVLTSPNITPSESGIGGWTKEQFIAKFKAYTDSSYVPQKVQPEEMQTVMPWTMYGGMEEEDLAAIYEYLRTVPPIENNITKFQAGKNVATK